MSHASLHRDRTPYVAGLIFALVLSSGVGAAHAVLEKTPAQSLVCLKLTHIDGTLAQTDRFLQGVSPIGVSFLARMGLGQVLGSPMMTGIDMKGDIALFVAAMTPKMANAGPMPPISIAALIPVTDYGVFIAGNTNCGPADDEGISTLTAQGVPPMFIASVDRFALIGPANDKQTFRQLQQEIAAQPSSLYSKVSDSLKEDSGKQSLWLYCNLPLINKTFGPLINGALQMAKLTVSGGQVPDVGMDPGEMIDSFGRMLTMFLQQSQYLTLSLQLSGEALRLKKEFSALPDTDLAALLQRSEAPRPNPFLGQLPDDALVNLAFNLNSSELQKLTDRAWHSASSMTSDFYRPEQLDVLRQMTSQMLQAISGCGVATVQLAPGAVPPVRTKTVVEVTDPAQFLKQLRKFSAFFTDIIDANALQKEAGLTLAFEHKANAQTYKGVPIDMFKLSLKQAADASASEGQIAKRPIGMGWDTRWAMVGKAGLTSTGGDPDQSIRQMIDGVKADRGARAQGGTAAAMALLPSAEQADLFLTMNLVRLYGLGAEQSPDRFPNVELPPSKSSLILATRMGESKASLDLILPKAHLVELRDLVQRVLMSPGTAGGRP